MPSDKHPFGKSRCGDILFERVKYSPRDLRKISSVYGLNCALAADLTLIPAERRAIFAQMLIESRTTHMRKDLRFAGVDNKDTVDRLASLLRQSVAESIKCQ